MDVLSATGSFDELTSFRCSRGLVSLPASIDEALLIRHQPDRHF